MKPWCLLPVVYLWHIMRGRGVDSCQCWSRCSLLSIIQPPVVTWPLPHCSKMTALAPAYHAHRQDDRRGRRRNLYQKSKSIPKNIANVTCVWLASRMTHYHSEWLEVSWRSLRMQVGPTNPCCHSFAIPTLSYFVHLCHWPSLSSFIYKAIEAQRLLQLAQNPILGKKNSWEPISVALWTPILSAVLPSLSGLLKQCWRNKWLAP